jgi:hypothetical protein
MAFSGAFLYAQKAEPSVPPDTAAAYDEGDFIIQWNDGSPRFIQRLSWNNHELAHRYEVILEEVLDRQYTEILRQLAQVNFLYVSLRPGHYRYRIGVYNLLNQLEYTTDWTDFEILSAFQPRIRGFTPAEFFPDTETRWEITITGEDITAGADITLRSRNSGKVIHPQDIVIEENNARIVFNRDQLPPDSYDVYIRNPGGLGDTQGPFTVHPSEAAEAAIPNEPSVRFNRLGFFVSAGYAPMIPLYGVLFAENTFEGFAPLGFAGRVGILPLVASWGSLGAELGVSWYKLDEQKEQYAVSAQILGARLSLLYQLWMPNRIFVLNFRVGAGINALLDFYFDYGNGRDDSFASVYLSLDGGLSLQVYVMPHLFVEAGADFTHILSTGDTAQPGYLRPLLSIGWRF